MQFLRKIAFPLSLLYAFAVFLRNWFYDIGIFPSYTFNTPTICVGNLSVGGTGKTPMVEWLIERLSPDNEIAVLSRGYKRKSRGFLMADANSTVSDIGDEPYQIYSKFPRISLAVDANRKRGIEELERTRQPEIIILDDAFQHRWVRSDLNLLLTPYDSLYTEDWYLPTGNLRDSRKQSRRADVIIVTKCPGDLDERMQKAIERQLSPSLGQHLLLSQYAYDGEVHTANGSSIELSQLVGRKLTLVTGIARPEPLTKFLRSETIEFEHLSYPDHHFFSEKEISLFNQKELVLTTEKDFTRLSGRVENLYYLRVQHSFLGNGDTLMADVLRKLGGGFV